MPPQGEHNQSAAAWLILLMRGLRSLAYGLLAVILGVVLAGEGFSPAAIGVLITVSLVGDMAGTYVIGLFADRWGRRRTLTLLALLMAATGVIFELVSSYPVLLVAAFFGTLGTSASETAPFLVLATWHIRSKNGGVNSRSVSIFAEDKMSSSPQLYSSNQSFVKNAMFSSPQLYFARKIL